MVSAVLHHLAGSLSDFDMYRSCRVSAKQVLLPWASLRHFYLGVLVFWILHWILEVRKRTIQAGQDAVQTECKQYWLFQCRQRLLRVKGSRSLHRSPTSNNGHLLQGLESIQKVGLFWAASEVDQDAMEAKKIEA